MSGEQFLFWLVAVATCGGAFAVVASQNVVRMAFWLVVSLGSTAALYFMLSADFVGATQLLIYVGGTVVLLIFGVMLTASGPYVKIKTAPSDLFISGAVGLVVLFLLVVTVTSVPWGGVYGKITQQTDEYEYPPEVPPGYNDTAQGNTARPIGLKLLGLSLSDIGGTPGKLSTGYLLPFEIVSVHLLVVLVGAGYLARAKRRAVTEGEVEGSGK